MSKKLSAALQLGGALAIAGALIAFAVSDIDLKWVGLGGFSALIFGYLGYLNKDLWKVPRFWLTLVALACIHSVLLIESLLGRRSFPVLAFVILGPIECGLLHVLLRRLYAP